MAQLAHSYRILFKLVSSVMRIDFAVPLWITRPTRLGADAFGPAARRHSGA
jgi:hypothetical protein